VNQWEIPPGRVATRTAVRFPLTLELRLETENGIIDAVTKDVSANGLLFAAKVLPRIGSTIEFTMNMPAQVMGLQSDLAIHCLGRVVRHQKNGDESMAAAVIDEYFLKA
jgi:hypothetical protein